ncbi:MAG: nickel pincer cofactor biosynthesis protein LarC [Clostridiales bacterium]|nr:nickel pincer cofactor biosynthesis protein LarC [Clostridiales bacterium]
MKSKLYLECYAGISGDMTVAALLDLGADQDKLLQALDSLGLDGYTVEISRVKKSGLDVCDFAVKLDGAHENHDHDMAYLHGSGSGQSYDGGHTQEYHSHDHGHDYEHGYHVHNHEHSHDHEHSRDHEHSHDHGHHSHDHGHGHERAHRGLPEIIDVIQSSEMTSHAKEIAVRIFDILAQAEAKAHGVPLEEVHFHEVGAVDSIVDIAAAAVCLDDLGIEDVIVPVLYEGCGYIRCQHGVIPVPVPATLIIVSEHQIRLHQTDTEGEFVTPTGAAIVAAICTETCLPETYLVERIGLGGGKRNYERPSILRAMLIAPQDDTTEPKTERMTGSSEYSRSDGITGEDNRDVGNGNRDSREAGKCSGENQNSEEGIWKLECNIDDCSGEAIGYAMERLFQAGARDVHYTPVFMKKNRPGYMITVLCAPEQRELLEEILFAETTTIGIRRQWMARSVLPRSSRMAETSLGKVCVKVTEYPQSGQAQYTPEYESVAEISREKKIPFRQAYQQILSELGPGK